MLVYWRKLVCSPHPTPTKKQNKQKKKATSAQNIPRVNKPGAVMGIQFERLPSCKTSKLNRRVERGGGVLSLLPFSPSFRRIEVVIYIKEEAAQPGITASQPRGNYLKQSTVERSLTRRRRRAKSKARVSQRGRKHECLGKTRWFYKKNGVESLKKKKGAGKPRKCFS